MNVAKILLHMIGGRTSTDMNLLIFGYVFVYKISDIAVIELPVCSAFYVDVGIGLVDFAFDIGNCVYDIEHEVHGLTLHGPILQLGI